MIPNRRNRVGAWLLVVTLLGAVALLVWFLPLVAALIFLALVTFAAIMTGRVEGFWRGLKFFIKEILFGW
jgi:hypothetical protein